MTESDNSKKNNALEEEFAKRDESLANFYAAEMIQMDKEEVASLTPILNSLKSPMDRYKRVAEIAEGGEKKISLVYDHRLDRRVAMAHSVKGQSAQDQEQFLREARLTANLSHPNIMPIYNMGIDEFGIPFFTMELVPGQSLQTIIRKLKENDPAYRQKYPLENLLNIYLKICDAIAYAHSRKVLHLDIKPDNIRVGNFGEVLVYDWGLARIIMNSAESSFLDSEPLDGDILNDMTLSGTMKGTPGFMAPEQTMAYSEKTEQTDIYALGAVLYMFLTLELPVIGRSANEVVDNTREGKIIPPRRRRPERRIPAGLAAVAMRALALKPEERYPNVEELQSDIKRHLAGYPTKAENANILGVLSLLMQRHSRISFLLFFFLLIMATIISVDLVVIRREKAQALAARDSAELSQKMYVEQQLVALRRGQDFGEALDYTVKSRDFINAPSMIQVLDTGIKERLPPQKEKNLLIQKGTLHFVLQQFNAASACFSQASNSKKTTELQLLSRKYAQIKRNDNTLLNDKQLASLFYEAQLDSLRSTIFYIYFHHMRRKTNIVPEEHIYLVTAMLDKINDIKRPKDWQIKPLKLIKNKKGYHLDLSQTPYEIYTLDFVGVYRRNILKPLGLNSLDISYTNIKKLSELRELSLDELWILGIDLPDAKTMLRELSSLTVKTIYIDVNKFSQDQLNLLRKDHVVLEANDQIKEKNTPKGQTMITN